MAWKDDIQTGFTITTGDGQLYVPAYLLASSNKAVEYNVAAFEFPNLSGTLVKRYLPKGNRYTIEIQFTGDDCWDIAKQFDESAKNVNPWVIAHPVYGSITVQPVGLNFDDSLLNVSRIICPVIETITEEGAQSSISPADKITADKDIADTALADTYAENVVPGVADKQGMTTNATNTYKEGKKIAGSASEDYLNAFNTANRYITNATSQPLAAITQVQALISAPARFSDTVENRINTLKSQFTKLNNSIANITSYPLKKLFENNAGTIVTSMALATVTNITPVDYTSRKKVVSIIDDLLSVYNAYLLSLDTLQSENGMELDSFISDSTALQAVSTLISFTVSNLFSIAQNAKQERTLITDTDTNWTLLAHKLYGLKPDDSTIEQLINDNEAGINEMIQVRAGRKIIYYV